MKPSLKTLAPLPIRQGEFISRQDTFGIKLGAAQNESRSSLFNDGKSTEEN